MFVIMLCIGKRKLLVYITLINKSITYPLLYNKLPPNSTA